MRNVLGIACVVALIGCQPLYGGKAERLKNPLLTSGKRGEAEVPPPKPMYRETCHTNFRAPSTGVVRNTAAASKLVQDGDTRLASSERAPIEAKLELIVDSMTRYRSALQKDPYDAEATLKLALAYDKTLRKGCALAMLQRLEMLSNHPDFAAEADRRKNQVRDNKQWFADYRTEALNQIP
jgi:hypothetical protein